jgi:hypothetical protein
MAARYYMNNPLAIVPAPAHFNLAGAALLEEAADLMPLKGAFYVVDIGVLVSQVYQCK